MAQSLHFMQEAFIQTKKAKDRSLRQLLQWDMRFPVGAAAGCDLLILAWRTP
jgi:hypothetical protein